MGVYLKNKLSNIDAFIFDFDGVLTNNTVYLNQDGNEWVGCSRSDGLAFNVLHKLDIPVYILSSEKNPIVTARANKLKVQAIQGVDDKVKAISNLAKEYKYDFNRILYVGNDVNDYYAMQMCGYSACPADSHVKIKQISKVILKNSGGQGIVRELLEDVLGIDFIEVLYDKN
jgi:YrbI family 3-deoxy-D-manno-octulosonate 8-phosphate phosphatase